MCDGVLCVRAGEGSVGVLDGVLSVSLSASVAKLNIHGITSSEITTHLVTVL